MVEQFLIDAVQDKFPSHRVVVQNGMISEAAGAVRQHIIVVTPDKRTLKVDCLVNEQACSIVGFSLDQSSQLNG
ncbi:hypothetical protein NVP1244A_070 [Vibrio phage 1.244.A._10N.261.54.C3]|nr:hypothetical protein NVP1244A_070 [Vibrio phage 1.244.A._10N.261.54.C3]AUR98698.1 hypothetical protein NVP1255O_070 [Vibrio phage 1.255.O._10N.286.45.F1]